MQHTKTLKVPIHWDTTSQKLSYLDNLTARLTYCVRLWSDVIMEHNIRYRKDLQNLDYQHYVQRKTKLSSSYVQQCGNKALWMWKQYRGVHRKWEWKLNHTNKNTKYYVKLLKREPSEPFSNPKSLIHKIPARIDYRTGIVKQVNLKLTGWVVKIATLKKNQQKMVVLLNPSNYHKNLLETGNIKDFEIIKKNKKYYTYIVCDYEVKDIKPKTLQCIDLGINRTVTTVLFDNKEPKTMFIRDKEKQDKLQFYEDLFAELKRGKHWKKLTNLRNKRRHITEYYDWITANQLANSVTDSVVVIGKLTYIRDKHFKGNEKKKFRKKVNQWTFLRITYNIQHKLAQKGVYSEQIFESWTSRTCNNCKSTNTIRPVQEAIFCCNCLNGFDADENACSNLGHKFLSKYATDGLAVTKDDLRLKPSMSLEAISSNL